MLQVCCRASGNDSGRFIAGVIIYLILDISKRVFLQNFKDVLDGRKNSELTL